MGTDVGPNEQCKTKPRANKVIVPAGKGLVMFPGSGRIRVTDAVMRGQMS